LDDTPGERRALVHFLAARVTHPDLADEVTDAAEAFFDAELPPDYPWPGNVRELRVAIRNIWLERRYDPPNPQGKAVFDPAQPGRKPPTADDPAPLLRAYEAGSLAGEDLLTRYAKRLYAQTGSYRETARRMRMDRRTIARLLGGNEGEGGEG